jgi:hypothetical protein
MVRLDLLKTVETRVRGNLGTRQFELQRCASKRVTSNTLKSVGWSRKPMTSISSLSNWQIRGA